MNELSEQTIKIINHSKHIVTDTEANFEEIFKKVTEIKRTEVIETLGFFSTGFIILAPETL